MESYAHNPAPFVLASLLVSYPEPQFGEYVKILLKENSLEIPASLRELLAGFRESAPAEDLRSHYIEVFERGQQANSPYETEYGRHRAMAKGQELGDIAGFYKAFGFELETEGANREMLDHVSVELEFYSLLLMKQKYFDEENNQEAAEILLDARKKFLNSHLGRFVGAIARRPGVQQSPYYSQVYHWLESLVDLECQSLGLSPDKTDWIESEKSDTAANCGVGCNE